MKKFIVILVAFILTVLPVIPALAAPDTVQFQYPNPSNTSIVINWLPAIGATSTVIRYKTNTYPVNSADGTLAYNGTGFQTVVTGLTAGQPYYFSAWGYDGVSYSATVAHMVVNTLAVAQPSGGTSTPLNPISPPAVPAGASGNASIARFNLEPFTSIIAHFNNAQGGLGMPINNAWEVIYTLITVFAGLWIYRSNKNFFVAYFVVFIMTCFGIGTYLMQWYLAPIELAVGIGVWALERFFQ